MTGNTDPIQEQILADARAISPEFSQELHQRTVRAMQAANLRGRASFPAISTWQAGLAIAASLLLAAVGWLVYSRPEVMNSVPRPSMIAQLQEPAPADVMILNDSFYRLLTPPAPPIDHIEQQVRAAAHYVAGQFPSSFAGGEAQRM